MCIAQIMRFAKEHSALDKPLFFDYECSDEWYSIQTFIAKKDIGFHWTQKHLIDGIEAYIEGEHKEAVLTTVRSLYDYLRRKDQQFLDFYITYCPDDDYYGCSCIVTENDLVVQADGIHITMSDM